MSVTSSLPFVSHVTVVLSWLRTRSYHPTLSASLRKQPLTSVPAPVSDHQQRQLPPSRPGGIRPVARSASGQPAAVSTVEHARRAVGTVEHARSGSPSARSGLWTPIQPCSKFPAFGWVARMYAWTGSPRLARPAARLGHIIGWFEN